MRFDRCLRQFVAIVVFGIACGLLSLAASKPAAAQPLQAVNGTCPLGYTLITGGPLGPTGGNGGPYCGQNTSTESASCSNPTTVNGVPVCCPQGYTVATVNNAAVCNLASSGINTNPATYIALSGLNIYNNL